MKKSKFSSRSSKKIKQDSNDYHQRIQNYKQDIDKIKTQVSQLQQKLDEQTDYDSTIDLTDDFLQDKYPTKTSKDIKPFSHEHSIGRKGKDRLAKKKQNENTENEELKKVALNIKTKNYQPRQASPMNSIDQQKRKQTDDNKNDIETPNIENYNQILTDNKVLAHKIKNLLVSNSNLDEENKSLKETNKSLNLQNHELNDQLTNAKTKLAKLEKINKELKSKGDLEIINNKSATKRAKSVNKIPVIIDANQIKEKVNSKEVNIDQLLSLEDENTNSNKKNSELSTVSKNNKHVEKENEKLKEKITNLINEYKQNEKDLHNKIEKLTADNKKLKSQLEEIPKQLAESSSTKKLREADSITIADLTDKIALLEEENRKLRSTSLSAATANIENQDLKKQLNHKQRSRPIDSETIANLTEKISDLTQENNNLKRSLISSRSLRSENDELKEKIEKLQNNNSKEMKKSSDSNINEISSRKELQEKIASLTEENNELKSQEIAHKSLERENAKLQHKYNSLIEAIQKTKPDQSAKKQIEKLKAAVNTFSKDNNNSATHISSRSININESDEPENNNNDEIKKLNEELSSSKSVIDRMEKEFAMQKKELKDNYDSLIKEITNDLQNKQNPKETQLAKEVKMLKQDLENQKRLYSSLEKINSKLQDQIAQTRANNLTLTKQIEEMNKQIEQLTGNTSSIQFSDQSENEKFRKNNEYDQIKTDFDKIQKSLNEVPDSSDSYTTKINKFKLESSQASSSSSNQKEAHDQQKRNSPSPISKKAIYQETNNKKSKYPYHPLENNVDSNCDEGDDEDNKNNFIDDDDEMDAFLNDNKVAMLSDNDNDTGNDDIDGLLNDNFTESETENENRSTNINFSLNSNKENTSNNNNSKNLKKKKSFDSTVDLDALLNTSDAGFDGGSTSEAFRKLVDLANQSKGDNLMNTEEEFEKLRTSFSSSLDDKEKNKGKSPKKDKKIEHLLLDEDLDDEKTFSD